MNETLIELLKLVKEASPIVWAAAVRQNNLYGISDILFGLLLLFFSIAGFTFLSKLYKAYREHLALDLAWRELPWAEREKTTAPKEPEILKWKDSALEGTVWGGIVFFTIVGLLNLFYGAMYLINPTYWTLRLLISLAS